jgi:small GTP-binding protein
MRTIQKKVCLLGDFAVGKTSLIRRYVEGRFDDKYLTTVGVVVSRKAIIRSDLALNLLIWDLAGGRDFSQSGYLLGAAGALIACDLTRAITLASFQTYVAQVRQVNPNIAVVLLGNKNDLFEERAVSDEQILSIANQLNAPVLLTSAKSGENVESAFSTLADALLSQAN